MSERARGEIHPVAESGFSRVADAYDRGRPDYPASAVAWLVATLRVVPGSTVVDLGAGTGKLTRHLVSSGARVIAVEPVPSMRAALEQALPDVIVSKGTAENMPLEDDVADAVTVAQAFHWFDVGRAAVEIARILRPSHGLGLVWNVRDHSDRVQAALEEILSTYRGETPTAYSWGGDPGAWREPLEALGLFSLAGEQQFANEQVLDSEAFVDRIASVSFIAASPVARREATLARVRALADSLPRPIKLRYVTKVYAYRRT